MDKGKLKGHAALWVANLVWGLNAPIGKSVLWSESNPGGVSPFALSVYRMLGACLLFWSVSFFLPRERVARRDIVLLLFASVFGIQLNQMLFLWGLSLTSPIDSSIIATVVPVLTMVLATLFLREPITWLKAGGVFLGCAGALLLILVSRHGTGHTSSVKGDVLCLVSAVSYATYLTAFRNVIVKYSPVTTMKWMFLFAAVAYVPALEPGRVAVRSQQARAERIARSLDRLDSAGRLVLTPVPLADTVRGARYRELYEALAYLYLRDTLRLAAFGLSSTERYAELFPSDFADYVRGWTDRVPAADTDGGATRFFYLPDDAEYALGDGYSRLWLPCYSSWAEFGNDTLRVDVGGERIRIAGAELLARQLARVGVASCEELRDSREHIEPLMDYRDARCRIIFSDLSLERTDSLGWRIAGAQLRAVMLR